MAIINQQTLERMSNEEISSFIEDSQTSEADRKEALHQLNLRKENTEVIEERKKQLGVLYSSSLCLASYTIADLSGKSGPDFGDLIDPLRTEIRKLVDGGPRELEIMLAANTLTLNFLSNHMLRCASNAKTVNVTLAYTEIALKAQDQTRKTVLSLAQIKNPQNRTFVAQQNVAQIQQVNNTPQQDPENELIREVPNEALESRRTEETIPTNPKVQAMAEIYRPENG